MTTIDLNADLGEGIGDDAGLLQVVTSANVACGFHAGDPATMQSVCRLAVTHRVAVGAQVSYRDREGFGRRFINVDPDELTADVLYQLGALDAVARHCGTRVAYLKPHGALYNRAVNDELHAAAVVAAVQDYDQKLHVLGLPNSRLLALADAAGLPQVPEAFVDRAYTAAGTLVPRGEPGAVLTDPDEVVAQAVRMAVSGQVVAVDGTVVPVSARSLCVHSDTPGALALAIRVREALVMSGVTIAPFVTA
jgi:5-oxoprolinase (ATP-hydrolysing) subunit A